MKVKIGWIIMIFGCFLYSQEAKKVNDKNLPKANQSYQQKKYAEAEKNYRISSHLDVNGAIPEYNMGNAIYRQKYPAESLQNFTKSLQKAKTKEEKHQIFHNMGNAMMQLKDYQNAVESFKNALRNNPNDEETRYNYALAKLYLKNNPPPPQDQNKNQDQQNEQNQQNQQNKDNKSDQNQDKDKQDKGDNDQNKSDNADPKEKQQKQQLENLLEAVNNEEKKTQEKVNAKKAQGRVIKQEKEW